MDAFDCFLGCSKQEGQREWNGRPSTELSIFEETCSMLSSSDLTIPDPCETYHDVHHGYTPSFATMATGSTFRQSLVHFDIKITNVGWFLDSVDSISTSSPSVRMTSLHGGSFDFLGGFRSSMEETMNLKKFRRSISPIQTRTLSTVHQGDLFVFSFGKAIDDAGIVNKWRGFGRDGKSFS